MMKLKWGQYDGPSSNRTGLLLRRGNSDTRRDAILVWAHRGKVTWGHSEKVAGSKARGEASGETRSAWYGTSSRQNCEKIHVCYLSYPVCGILLSSEQTLYALTAIWFSISTTGISLYVPHSPNPGSLWKFLPLCLCSCWFHQGEACAISSLTDTVLTGWERRVQWREARPGKQKPWIPCSTLWLTSSVITNNWLINFSRFQFSHP